MSDAQKLPVQAMADLGFVEWDRYAIHEATGTSTVYGWIQRPDGRADFVILLVNEEGIGYVTSSASCTAEIGRILGGGETHAKCIRVEDLGLPADVLPNVAVTSSDEMEPGATVKRAASWGIAILARLGEQASQDYSALLNLTRGQLARHEEAIRNLEEIHAITQDRNLLSAVACAKIARRCREMLEEMGGAR